MKLYKTINNMMKNIFTKVETSKWSVNDVVKVKDPSDRETWKHNARLIPVTILKIDKASVNSNNISWIYTVEDPHDKHHTFQVFECDIFGSTTRYWFIRANKKIGCTFIGLSPEADAFHFHTGNMYSTSEDAYNAQQRMLNETPNIDEIRSLMRKNKE